MPGDPVFTPSTPLAFPHRLHGLGIRCVGATTYLWLQKQTINSLYNLPVLPCAIPSEVALALGAASRLPARSPVVRYGYHVEGASHRRGLLNRRHADTH